MLKQVLKHIVLNMMKRTVEIVKVKIVINVNTKKEKKVIQYIYYTVQIKMNKNDHFCLS